MTRTALITGASGGIGYELTLLLPQYGYDCVLVARSEGKLKELAARLAVEGRVLVHALEACDQMARQG